MSTKLQEISNRYAKFKKQQRKDVEEAIQSVFKDIQKETPEVKSLVFSGMIPYFNDGEPCVFSLGEVWFRKVDNVVEKPSQQWEEENNDIVVDQTPLMQELLDFIDSQSDIIEDIYGSNFVATITANKTTVLEYTDHD